MPRINLQTGLKICNRCKQEKLVNQFHKNRFRCDGLTGQCKDCRQKMKRQNIEKNREHNRKYFKAHRDSRREYGRRRYHANPKYFIQKTQEYQARNPEKNKCRNIINGKIKHNKRKRGKCFMCGTPERIHAHHENYKFPLWVLWICIHHHGWYHRMRKELLSQKEA